MTGRHGRYLHPYFNDRRSGKEQRKFSYTEHLPERRAGKDRRSGLERRTGKDRKLTLERRKIPWQMKNKVRWVTNQLLLMSFLK